MKEKVSTWKYTNETIEMSLDYWQCPDCRENILIYPDIDDIERYRFCPFCGARRIENVEY